MALVDLGRPLAGEQMAQMPLARDAHELPSAHAAAHVRSQLKRAFVAPVKAWPPAAALELGLARRSGGAGTRHRQPWRRRFRYAGASIMGSGRPCERAPRRTGPHMSHVHELTAAENSALPHPRHTKCPSGG